MSYQFDNYQWKKKLSTANKNKSCAKCMFTMTLHLIYHEIECSKLSMVFDLWNIYTYWYAPICDTHTTHLYTGLTKTMRNPKCITILYSDKHNITPPPLKKKNLGKLLPPACNPLWQSTHYIVLATPFIWPSCLEILDMIFWAINYFLGTD